jgi:hypothetical protein
LRIGGSIQWEKVRDRDKQSEICFSLCPNFLPISLSFSNVSLVVNSGILPLAWSARSFLGPGRGGSSTVLTTPSSSPSRTRTNTFLSRKLIGKEEGFFHPTQPGEKSRLHGSLHPPARTVTDRDCVSSLRRLLFLLHTRQDIGG